MGVAAPPVIVGTVISLGWTIAAGRSLRSGRSYSAETTFYYVFLWFGSIVIGDRTIATLVVMGGASRNLFPSAFWRGDNVSRDLKNTWRRLGGLVFASSIIAVVLGTLGFVIFYFGLIVGCCGDVDHSRTGRDSLVAFVLAVAVVCRWFGTMCSFALPDRGSRMCHR